MRALGSRRGGDKRVPLNVHALTHVGRVRKRNEDAHQVHADQGVLIVADGMGGHQAGDVASRLAVDTVAAQLLNWSQRGSASIQNVRERLAGAVQAANRAIFERAHATPDLNGMGTTLVAAVFHHNRIIYANVGDSRLYRLRGERLRQLTRDHSLIQESLDAGVFRDRAEAHAAGVNDNVLTRSLGIQPDTEVDVSESVWEPDDLYLLCSDGLTGKLTPSDLTGLIDAGERNLERAAVLLCADALRKDGSDNITLVLAQPRRGDR